METIEVKFRGDGGPEYTGPERRNKEKGKGTAEDRVGKEIGKAVRDATRKRTSTKPVLTINYSKTPEGHGDGDEFREDVIHTAIADVVIKLAEEAITLEQT